MSPRGPWPQAAGARIMLIINPRIGGGAPASLAPRVTNTSSVVTRVRHQASTSGSVPAAGAATQRNGASVTFNFSVPGPFGFGISAPAVTTGQANPRSGGGAAAAGAQGPPAAGTQAVCARPGCGRRGAFQCRGCLGARYCSLPCSQGHWTRHRRDCRSRQGFQMD